MIFIVFNIYYNILILIYSIFIYIQSTKMCEFITNISPLNFIKISPFDKIMLISFQAWREAENEYFITKFLQESTSHHVNLNHLLPLVWSSIYLSCQVKSNPLIIFSLSISLKHPSISSQMQRLMSLNI